MLKLSDAELRVYWELLHDEIRAAVEGEIDEASIEQKRALFSSPSHGKSALQLTRYGRAASAGTAAGYVHCLWHEVTMREGAKYLPVPALRRRMELMRRWFPPDRGYHLFPARGGSW